jgi:hypothetical protein
MTCRHHALAALFGVVAGLVWTPVEKAGAEDLYYRGPTEAQLAPRSALVVGVSVYSSATFPTIPNAIRDAEQIRKVLADLGFEVFPKVDPAPLTRQAFKTILYDYVAHVKEVGGASVIYFAGHGLSFAGGSYLAPFDGMAYFTRDLREELIPMDLLSDALFEMSDAFHIVILDACRNEGLRKLPAFGKGDAVEATAGVRFQAPRDMFWATSADDGQFAKDGDRGSNSPFATALAAYMRSGDLHISQVFDNVQLYMKSMPPRPGETPQDPVYKNKGGATFYFAPTRRTYDEEKKAWDAIDKASAHPDDFQRFLDKFPAGYFAGQARQLKYRARPPEAISPPVKQVTVAPARITLSATIARDPVNLRDSPSTDARIVRTYPAGFRAQVILEQADWTLVRLPDDMIGYVPSNLLESVPITERGLTLVYQGGSDDPPATLDQFLGGLNLADLQQINIVARVEPNVEAVTSARISKIRSVLAGRKINSAIVKTLLVPPESPAQLDQIDVRTTVTVRSGI